MTGYQHAHGAETTWLAIDDEDHVGQFYTGSSGALPAAWDGTTDLFGIDAMLLACGVPVQVDRLRPEDLDEWNELIDEANLDGLQPGAMQNVVLMELGHPRAQDLIPKATRVASTRGVYALAGMVEDELLIELLQGGQVVRLWTEMWTIPPPALGVFSYEHGERWETRLSGPYVRRGKPRAPIERVDLPPSLRKLAVHLSGVRFQAGAEVQPAAHVPCIVDKDHWADLNGKVWRQGE